MRMIIIADPLARLKPAGDTSMAFARGASARGWDVHWCDARSIWLEGHRVWGRCALWTSGTAPHPTTDPAVAMPLDEAQIILIRPDPPFDIHYISLCWWLMSLAHRVVIGNPPAALIAHHEKLVPYLMRAAGVIPDTALVPTCVTQPGCAEQAEILHAFAAGQSAPQSWVVKPWLGYGGNGIRKFDTIDAVVSAVAESHVPLMVQPFVPEIFTEGDRRVLVVGGAVTGSFVRLPAAGNFVANLAQGGSAEARPMTPAQDALCSRIGAYLLQQGIDFAGIDLVGHYVTEVNVTSPTGVMSVQSLLGIDAVTPYLDRLAQRVAALKG